jgi:hypothetical protein
MLLAGLVPAPAGAAATDVRQLEATVPPELQADVHAHDVSRRRGRERTGKRKKAMPLIYVMYAILVVACAAILFPSEVVELIEWVQELDGRRSLRTPTPFVIGSVVSG